MSWRRFARRIRFVFYWPGLFLYFIASQRSRVLIICDNEVLLIQDRTTYFFDERSWNLPGGGIKRSEEKVAGAIREVREELGIDLLTADVQPLGERTSGNYGLRYKAHFFVVQFAQKPAVTVDNHEVNAAQWFKLDYIKQLPCKNEVAQGLALFTQQ